MRRGNGFDRRPPQIQLECMHNLATSNPKFRHNQKSFYEYIVKAFFSYL